MSKPNAAAVPTDELLQELNADKAAAAAEMAPPAVVPTDHITLPAGELKVIFLRPSQILETRARAARGGRPVPAFMVYVRGADGKATGYAAHSFSGPEVEPRVHLSEGKLPYRWLPSYVVGASAFDPSSQLNSLDWWLETTGALTIITEPRETFVSAEATPVAKEVTSEPMPAIPHFAFVTPKIAAFLEVCEDFIIHAHASGQGRAVGAAHALTVVATNLFTVDQMPKAAPQKAGDNILNGLIDPYPEGSAIVHAADDSGMPTPQLSAGYTAALALLASRAMDRDKRATCEGGANLLALLRDSLRNLKA